MVAAVERVFRDLTLSRTVEGRAARVPFESYVVFVDAPDVTAAAARFRRLARYEVQALGEDWYRADDRAGARGLYRVLLRDRTRRVILSWGEHTGSLLGTISGSALTLLELDPRDGQVGQRITVYVQIDQAFAAALARLLVVVFGGIADRKLTEGFTVAARVAEWAVEHPGEFCPWLRAETSLDPARRERVLAAVPGCR